MFTSLRRSVLAVLLLLLGGTACAPDRVLAPHATPSVSFDPSPGSPGLYVGWTWNSCQLTTADADHDGVSDLCERALAAAFAPALQVQPDCVWDSGASGPGGPPTGVRPGGDYGYAVQRVGTKIRIAYLPAYYYDCGSDVLFFGPHSGDSEFILIDVIYNAASQHWTTDGVFLSAHCGSALDDWCKWYPKTSFQYYQGKSLGAPIVWVSVNKHANYPSQSACTFPQGYPDECPSAQYLVRFPVTFAQQNIGSADYPNPWRGTGLPYQDCQPPLWQSPRLLQLNANAYSSAYYQCWWKEIHSGGTTVYFDGWINPTGARAVAYGKLMRIFAGFQQGQSQPPLQTSGVTISGSIGAKPFATCGYTAEVTGGTPPFTYDWFIGGAHMPETSDEFSYTNTGQSYSVELLVIDANRWARYATLSVPVSANAPHCLGFQEW